MVNRNGGIVAASVVIWWVVAQAEAPLYAQSDRERLKEAIESAEAWKQRANALAEQNRALADQSRALAEQNQELARRVAELEEALIAYRQREAQAGSGGAPQSPRTGGARTGAPGPGLAAQTRPPVCIKMVVPKGTWTNLSELGGPVALIWLADIQMTYMKLRVYGEEKPRDFEIRPGGLTAVLSDGQGCTVYYWDRVDQRQSSAGVFVALHEPNSATYPPAGVKHPERISPETLPLEDFP